MFQIDKLYNVDRLLIELIEYNSYIRNIKFDVLKIYPQDNVFETIVKQKLHHKIFTKGYDRIIMLKYFIIDNMKNMILNNDENILILITNIMSFIVLNQVFGDGNHRVAHYMLMTILDNKLQHVLNDKKYMYETINLILAGYDKTHYFENYIYNGKPIDFFSEVSNQIYSIIYQNI